MALVFEAVAYVFMEVIALGTGALLLLAVTFGTIRVARTAGGADLPWYGLGRDAEGRMAASAGFATMVGIAAWLGLAVLLVSMRG